MKKKTKPTLYQKARASKTVVTTFWVFLSFLLFGGVVTAVTTITDTNVNSPTGTYTNISANRINDIFYVDVNNGTDIGVKTQMCSGTTGCTVIIPPGFYNLGTLENITLKSYTTLQGYGDASWINVTDAGAGDGRFYMETNASNITIKDFTIDYNNVSAAGLQFLNSDHNNIIFSGIHYMRNEQQIVIYGDNIVFEDNFLDDVGNGFGMNSVTNDSKNYYIRNNRIINKNWNSSSPTEYGEGIEINNHNEGYALIENNFISGFREEGIDCNIGDCNIMGNTIIMVSNEGRTTRGITIGTGEVNNSHTEVIGNRIYNISASGHGINIGNGISSASVIGNTFKGATLSATSYGLYTSSDTVLTAIGNSFNNLNTAIRLGEENSSLIGNIYSNITTRLEQFGQSSLIHMDNLGWDVRGVPFITLDGNVTIQNIGTNSFKLQRLELFNEMLQISLDDNGAIYNSTQDEQARGSHTFFGRIFNVGSAVATERLNISMWIDSSNVFRILRSSTQYFEFITDGNNNKLLTTIKPFSIGTSDEVDLIFVTNNTEGMRMQSGGDILISNNLNITGTLQLEMNITTVTCNEANAGAIYYNNDTNKHYGCNVTGWNAFY